MPPSWRPRSPQSRGRDVPDRVLVQRTDVLVDLTLGRSVLHLGCSNWPYTDASDDAGALLHRRLDTSCRELWGLDDSLTGLGALQERGFDRLLHGDLRDLAGTCVVSSPPPLEDMVGRTAFPADGAGGIGPFEVVIAGEVLEHLTDPGALLRDIHRLLAPGAELIVTVPNAYCAFRFGSYALGRWRGNPEPVHPDHVAYYSAATLTHLLHLTGYEVIDLSFYDLGTEHRASAPRMWRLVNDVAMKVAPQLADGVLARCRTSP